MRLVRQPVLIEERIKHFAKPAQDSDIAHHILAPALDRIARAPIPSARLAVHHIRGAAARSPPDHHQMLPDFVAARIERRIKRKRLGDFKDPQVAGRIFKPAQNRVGRALVKEFVRGEAEMFGGDEVMRGDRSSRKLPKAPSYCQPLPLSCPPGSVVLAAGSPVRNRITPSAAAANQQNVAMISAAPVRPARTEFLRKIIGESALILGSN